MKIALLAPSEETVPPVTYGGTELVIHNIAEGLVAKGHDVHLFASGDSRTMAHLRPTFPKATRSLIPVTNGEGVRSAYSWITLARSLKALQEEHFDVIHNHLGWTTLPFQPLLDAPIVTTIHGPYDMPFVQTINRYFADTNFVSISESQAKAMPEIPFVGTVYNGIAVNNYSFNAKPKDYVAFLGRISPEKGPKEAIMAAKAAGVRLIMAAKVDVVDQPYFEKEIKPLIDGEQIQFIGEVNLDQKVELLRNARALLMLIQWDEPFGLVMTESLACGTPVIAIKRGSVGEIIDGKNGIIVENTTESAARAIQEIDKIDRAYCRSTVIAKFSTEAMVAGYESVYRHAVARKRLSAKKPYQFPAGMPVTSRELAAVFKDQ